MINWLIKKKFAPMHLIGGDSISLTYTSARGRKEVVSHPVTKAATYDTMAVGELENEIGFESGIVSIIGNES